MIQFVILTPLLGAIVSGFFYRLFGEKNVVIFSTMITLVGAFLSWLIFLNIFEISNETTVLFNWISSDNFSADWSLKVDSLVKVMLVVILSVSSLVHVYSIGYMRHDHNWDDGDIYKPRFFAYLSFFTFAMLVLSVAGMVGPVEKQFFPGSDRPEILIDVNLAPGTSVTTTDTTVKRLEELLDSMGGVENYASYVGGGAPRFFISVNPEHPDSSFAKIIVTTTGPVERDRIIAALDQHVANGTFAEARIRIRRLLFGPPVDWPVSFRVVGQDPATLRKVAHQVREVMSHNPHVVNPHLEWDQRVPTLKLEIDEQRLRLMGLTPLSVAQQMQYRTDGVPIAEVRQDIRTVDVYVRGQGAKRAQNEPPIYELRNEQGQKIPLSKFVKIFLTKVIQDIN